MLIGNNQMKVEPVTKEIAEASLPETFEDVAGEVELTDEEAEQAAMLLIQAMKDNPDQHYFRIVV
jgi:hypothetical protein